ncbi:MAG TPA: choice-of-anchor Q domain-containing protein [Chthoniobacterales bacterium]|nr:choice-of-anchor Q domain-containing protein [Chthoniobacterales bacterium]
MPQTERSPHISPICSIGTFAPLVVALLILLPPTVPAATIRVPADQPTIQQAIAAAANGDLVLVSPGVYFERIDYLGRAISIQSTDGPTRTIIDGNLGGTVVTLQTQEGAQSVLTGFTIRRGNATFGAGMTLLGTSPTITGNIFRDNIQQSGGFGAAIAGNGASPVVEGNTFLANTCDTQHLSGVVSFVNGSSPLIINNIFSKNPCWAINITLPAGFSPVIAHNTFVQNRAGVRTDGRFSSTHLFANNILVRNTIGLLVAFPDTQPPVWKNNLVFLNTTNYSGIADQTGLNGNISSDPLFLPVFSTSPSFGSSSYNFQLQPGSPAIDAGSLSVPGLPPIDFLGRPRVVDGNGDDSALPDLGAYEFIPPTSGVPSWPDPIGTALK